MEAQRRVVPRRSGPYLYNDESENAVLESLGAEIILDDSVTSDAGGKGVRVMVGAQGSD
jgi:hypothetical protein